MSPIIQAQADSLSLIGITVDNFIISGKGMLGYLKALSPLSKVITKGSYDVIHAHYSLSGYLAYFALLLARPVFELRTPVIVSLMGSDVKQSGPNRILISFFVRKLWSHTIVKSADMQDSLRIADISVIPNGVSLLSFREMPKQESRDKLNLETSDNVIILFGADKARYVKNYALAKDAISWVKNRSVFVLTLGDVPHSTVPLYINSSDLVLLTSYWEGSPNIVKEAMACNCPIVSTDVGDVRWLLDGVSGCYIATHDAEDVADKIESALRFEGRTTGRDRIKELSLDSESIANKLLKIYQDATAKYE